MKIVRKNLKDLFLLRTQVNDIDTGWLYLLPQDAQNSITPSL